MNEELADLNPYHTILLVEDDIRLSALITEYLQNNGLQVETQYRGDDAVAQIISLQPDLVVLDIMLPGLDGFEVCKQVRNAYAGPILMMTAKDEDIDQVVGLEIGADDYVVKPVQPRLLLARIRALLRRLPLTSSKQTLEDTGKKDHLNFGTLTITFSSRRVTLKQKNVNFSTTEFDLLWLLASQAGNILSRDKISESLTGVEYDGLDRSIDIRISRLRKLLGDDPNEPRGIKTVRGQGYLFVSDGWNEQVKSND